MLKDLIMLTVFFEDERSQKTCAFGFELDDSYVLLWRLCSGDIRE
jgi:hypothetical protein